MWKCGYIRWHLFQYHLVYVCAHVCTILNWVQSVNFVLLLRSMCQVVEMSVWFGIQGVMYRS